MRVDRHVPWTKQEGPFRIEYEPDNAAASMGVMYLYCGQHQLGWDASLHRETALMIDAQIEYLQQLKRLAKAKWDMELAR